MSTAAAAMTSPKAKALKPARTHLAEIPRAHHPELVEQIESRLLWEDGWRPETWDAERNAPPAGLLGRRGISNAHRNGRYRSKKRYRRKKNGGR